MEIILDKFCRAFYVLLILTSIFIGLSIVFRAFLYIKAKLFPRSPQLAEKPPLPENKYRIKFDGVYYTIERLELASRRVSKPYLWTFSRQESEFFQKWYPLTYSSLCGNPIVRSLLSEPDQIIQEDYSRPFKIQCIEAAKSIIDWEIEAKIKYPEYTYYPPEKNPIKPTMVKYKFRAECLEDVKAFHSKIDKNIEYHLLTDSAEGFPDIEVELTTSLTRPKLITLMRTIPDGHVMWQTLQPIENYTGERDYSI